MRLKSIVFSFAAFMSLMLSGQGVPPSDAPPTGITEVKPVLIGVNADGSEVRENLSPGTFELDGTHSSAASYIPLAGIFAGSTISKLSIQGEISESKAPSGLKRIELPGYSVKKCGQWGSVVLAIAKVDSGKRYLKTKDLAIEKDYIKPLANLAKLGQDADGNWSFTISKPLPVGHYVITFTKNPPVFWDFDVK